MRRAAGASLPPLVPKLRFSGMARIFSFSVAAFLAVAAAAALAPLAARADMPVAPATSDEPSAASDAPPRADAPRRKRERDITLKPIDGAKLALEFGDLAGAKNILEQVLRNDPTSIDGLFLMGFIASGEKKFAEAIPYYRKIIVDHPNIVRVRLDLARAL